MFPLLLFVLGSFLGPCQGDVTRSVLRSGDSGTVNLVELDIRGVTYGKCSFNDHHTEIELLFEEHNNGKFLAKALGSIAGDPVAKAKECREAATKKSSRLRTNIGHPKPVEKQDEVYKRLNELQAKLGSNQAYISTLKPRFIFPTTSSSSSSATSFGLSVGNPLTSFPGLGIGVPSGATNTNSNLSFGLGLPIKFGRRK